MNIDAIVLEKEKIRLTNQIWKLIPMREKKEDWRKHLDVILQELSGMYETLDFHGNQNFFTLMTKLSGLNTIYCCKDFMLYRKTVFRCIDLLSKVLNNEQIRINGQKT